MSPREFFDEIKPVHPWHPDVDQQTRRSCGHIALQKRFGGRERRGRYADGAQKSRQAGSNRLLVLDDEDRRMVIRHTCFSCAEGTSKKNKAPAVSRAGSLVYST